jgi:hypothetical protein
VSDIGDVQGRKEENEGKKKGRVSTEDNENLVLFMG